MKKDANRFYVYQHIRLDTKEVFYVGKGTGRRAWHKAYHNPRWHHIVNKCGYKVEILINNLGEQEAFDKEIEYIAFYQKQGYCKANWTLGGEGWSGMKHSDATKKKLSEQHKGKKVSEATRKKIGEAGKGKKMSEETKLKIILAVKGHKKSEETRIKLSKTHGGRPFEVYNTKYELVGVWNTVMQCERDLKIAHQSVSAVLRKLRNKTVGGYFFRYVGDSTSLEELYRPTSKEEVGHQHSLAIKGRFGGHKHGRAKKVIDLKTGKIWDCAKYAAKELNIVPTTLYGKLAGFDKNTTTLRYLDTIKDPQK